MCRLEEIESKIISIMKENMDFDASVSVSDRIESLGINSISFIKIVVQIETEFGFEFEDDDLNYNVFQTLKDLVVYIKDKV